MKKILLDYVVCPECKNAFDLRNEKYENSEIIQGNLICSNNHIFKISNFIPRLLPKKNIENSKIKTQKSFSAKWKRIPNCDEYLSMFQKQWYLERYGFQDENTLSQHLKNKKYIVDAGTGLGRNAYWHAKLSPKSIVFAVDISESIDIAWEKCKSKKNIFCIQADITKLPFKKNFFDYVICDQVIHHTPNPEETFKHLLIHTRRSGEILIYTYRKKGPIREFCDNYIRKFSTEMSEEECYKLSKAITLFGKYLSDLNFELEIPEDIQILDIKKGKYNLQRWLYWNVLKCFWNDNYPLEINIMINFDWYHPKNAFRYSPEEIKDWCKKNNVKIKSFNVVESGISVRGSKK